MKVKPGPLSAWRRVGEREAEVADCAPFDMRRFREALTEARGFTVDDPCEAFNERLPKLCATAGVVLVPELKGLGVNGATYRVRKGTRPVIQLSLRNKVANVLRFAFFHEAGHVVLHGRKEFIETGNQVEHEEQEAGRFAADLLIPPAEFEPVRKARPRSDAEVRRWATRLGIAPGILVGRLQHEKLLPPKNLNGLKVPIQWCDQTSTSP